MINNFLIEIGILHENFNDIREVILKICNNYIKTGASLIIKSVNSQKVYFNVVPKINYDVTYGYGSLAPLGNSICGDNYLIKQLDNSRIIAAISDGMGKGLNANIQSSNTLRMIDQITSMNIKTDTALQILNTMIYIQDYQEVYSTLDFIEINRQDGEALLYKAGGTTTYLFHQNGEYKKINNENLPFGIEEIINTKKIKLENNDLILLASDGVFENIINNDELEKFIVSIRHLDPQKLIYELLNHIRYAEVINRDDISIVALKIQLC
jgi:stage II sporulation protein E